MAISHGKLHDINSGKDHLKNELEIEGPVYVGLTSEGYVVGGDNRPLTTFGGFGLCFSGDVKVKTTTGDKNIADLTTSDVAIAYNTDTNIQSNANVLSVSSHDITSYWKINSTKVTGEHPYWTKFGWKPAIMLTVGEKIFNGTTWEDIVSKDNIKGNLKVYSIQVDTPNTFFADGYLVHNKSPGPRSGKNLYLCGGLGWSGGAVGRVLLNWVEGGTVPIGTTYLMGGANLPDDTPLIFDNSADYAIYYNSTTLNLDVSLPQYRAVDSVNDQTGFTFMNQTAGMYYDSTSTGNELQIWANSGQVIMLYNNTNIDGSLTVSGDIEITDSSKGVILKSATKRWRLQVDDLGALSVTEIV